MDGGDTCGGEREPLMMFITIAKIDSAQPWLLLRVCLSPFGLL